MSIIFVLLITQNMSFSGRELFLSDASLFVDDVDADTERYQREDSDAPEETVSPAFSCFCLVPTNTSLYLGLLLY